jgi:hypothetical protein
MSLEWSGEPRRRDRGVWLDGFHGQKQNKSSGVMERRYLAAAWQHVFDENRHPCAGLDVNADKAHVGADFYALKRDGYGVKILCGD